MHCEWSQHYFHMKSNYFGISIESSWLLPVIDARISNEDQVTKLGQSMLRKGISAWHELNRCMLLSLLQRNRMLEIEKSWFDIFLSLQIHSFYVMRSMCHNFYFSLWKSINLDCRIRSHWTKKWCSFYNLSKIEFTWFQCDWFINFEITMKHLFP